MHKVRTDFLQKKQSTICRRLAARQISDEQARSFRIIVERIDNIIRYESQNRGKRRLAPWDKVKIPEDLLAKIHFVVEKPAS